MGLFKYLKKAQIISIWCQNYNFCPNVNACTTVYSVSQVNKLNELKQKILYLPYFKTSPLLTHIYLPTTLENVCKVTLSSPHTP